MMGNLSGFIEMWFYDDSLLPIVKRAFCKVGSLKMERSLPSFTSF